MRDWQPVHISPRSKMSASQAAKLRVVNLVAWTVVAACAIVAVLKGEELQALSAYDSSPIDWCEINYEVHPWVAEFWNSISSIPIALVAPLVRINDLVPRYFWSELRSSMAIILSLIVIIGIGSTYFHATLSVFGQIMDEMGIIWIVQYSALFILPPGEHTLLVQAAFLPSVFLGYIFFSTLLGLFLPIVSHILVLSCAPIGLYIHVKAFQRSQSKTAKHRFRLALRFFFAAWACWLTDRLLCPQVQQLREIIGFQPQLHACWHILIGITAYILIGVCCEYVADARREVKQAEPLEIV